MLLGAGTARECLQRLGSLAAMVDIAVTLPAWAEPARGRLRFVRPRVAGSVDEAFRLAAYRQVRTAGFPDHYADHERWSRALGARAGLSPRGQLTLREAGNIVGVTRERVRQVETPYRIRHHAHRRWPTGEAVEAVHGAVRAAIGQRVDASQPSFEAIGIHHPTEPHAVAASLLAAFGVPTATHVDSGKVLRAGPRVLLPPQLDRAHVRDVAWELSGRSGVLRTRDLLDALRARVGDVAPGDLEAAVRAALDMTDLPRDYAVVIRSADMALFSAVRRMLSWSSPLTVAQLHAGLTRKARMRGPKEVPPPDMLHEMLVRHDDFVVILDFVARARVDPPDTTTVLGWIGEQVRASESQVLHRSIILDRARRAGLNQTSVMMNLTFGETVVPVGKGCFTLVGRYVEPDVVEQAWRDASRRFIKSEVEVTAVDDRLVLRCIVGTHFRDSGQVTLDRPTAERLGTERYALSALGATRGTMTLSQSTLHGFVSAFNALEIDPGDEVEVCIDLDAATATVTRARPADARRGAISRSGR